MISPFWAPIYVHVAQYSVLVLIWLDWKKWSKTAMYVICAKCVCFQSGFISIVLYMQSHVYTTIHLETLIMQRFIPSCSSWPSFPGQWNPFCYWQTPCKSASLTHTHSISSFMAKLLFFCSPSGDSCSRAYSVCSHLWRPCLRFLEGLILWSISARCVCVC